MTCDKINGKLDYLINNNNITNGSAPKEDNNQNEVKLNGKLRNQHINDEEIATKKSMIILLTIFLVSALAMFYIYKNFPELEE